MSFFFTDTKRAVQGTAVGKARRPSMNERVKRKGVKKQILNHICAVNSSATTLVPTFFNSLMNRLEELLEVRHWTSHGNFAVTQPCPPVLQDCQKLDCKEKHHLLYWSTKGKISCTDCFGKYVSCWVWDLFWKSPISMKDLQVREVRDPSTC